MARSSSISRRTEPSHQLPSPPIAEARLVLRERCSRSAGADTAWAVTRDGERFLLAVPAGHATPSPFSVVFNWQAAVKR